MTLTSKEKSIFQHFEQKLADRLIADDLGKTTVKHRADLAAARAAAKAIAGGDAYYREAVEAAFGARDGAQATRSKG